MINFILGLYVGISLAIVFVLVDDGKRNVLAIILTAVSWPLILFIYLSLNRNDTDKL